MTLTPQPLVVKVPGWMKLLGRLVTGTNLLSRNPILVVDEVGMHFPTMTAGQMITVQWEEMREIVVKRVLLQQWLFVMTHDADAVLARQTTTSATLTLTKQFKGLSPSPFGVATTNIPLTKVITRIRRFSDVPIHGV